MVKQMLYVSLAVCSAMFVGPPPLAQAGDLDPPPGPIEATGRFGPRTEISEAKTPGVADSLFEITEPGSYYLSGNITGVSGKNGIKISSSGVTLDLNGFSLIGVSGTLSGIQHSGLPEDLTIVNGTVTGWGNHGIALGNARSCVLNRIHSTHNGSAGFNLGATFRIVECAANLNASIGFDVGNSTVVIGCTARGNDGGGFQTGDNALVIDSTAPGNQGFGIFVRDGCTVNRCTASENNGTGIKVQGGGGNDAGTMVTGCNAVNNTAAGIHVSGGNGHRIEDNNVSSNDIGIDVDSSGNIIIGSTASGNTTNNYDIAGGNHYGELISPGAGFTNCNSWANFDL